MIEGLAKTIGYGKVRVFTSTADPLLLNDFIRKTGIKVKIYVSQEYLTRNNIEAVPVTIIETVDGRKMRFDGFTDNFTGQASAGNGIPPQLGQQPTQASQGANQQCGSR